jgi:arginine utilization protein RocB
MSFDLSVQVNEIFKELIAIRSDTGTESERDIEEHIYNRLGKTDYFTLYPEQYGKYKLQTGHLGRSVVWALVKGKGKQTVILMHHHDTVDASDYGKLSSLACHPGELQESLKNMELPDEVRADLESGKWIFGRGSSDMKSGAAVQLALTEYYSKKPDLKGNLLLLSVPDGKSLSEGMRKSIELLKNIKEQFKLEYLMMIGSEPHHRGADGQGILYEGSAGKLLPVIYVRGKKRCISHIFEGLNPLLLLSEIVLETELNTDFSEVVGDEVSPPPSWNLFRDRKLRCDASIPMSAGGYFSVIMLKKTPDEIMSHLKKICENAFKNIIEKTNKSYQKFREKHKPKQGEDAAPPLPDRLPWTVNIKTFSELYEAASDNFGHIFIEEYENIIRKIKNDVRENRISVAEVTFSIIEKTLDYLPDQSPIVVIALAPPYYPPMTNARLKLSEQAKTLSDRLIRLAGEEWNASYKKLNYKMDASDMCYASIRDGDKIAPFIKRDMPLWKEIYDIPFTEMEELSIPIINIGPWGKDCHKFTERVFRQDVFETVPTQLHVSVEHLLSVKLDKAEWAEQFVYPLIKNIHHAKFHEERQKKFGKHAIINSALIKIFAHRLACQSFEILKDKLVEIADEIASAQVRKDLLKLNEADWEDAEENAREDAPNLIRAVLLLLRKAIDRCMGIKEEPEREKVRWVASPNGTLVFKGKLSGETPKMSVEPQASADGEKLISDADKVKKTEQEQKPALEENREIFKEAAYDKSSDKKKKKHDSTATAEGTDGSWKNRTLEDALSSLGGDGLDELIYGKKRRKNKEGEDINEDDEKWMDWID